VQGATVTAGLRLIRFAFPVCAPVHTYRRPPSATTQTGVATGLSSRRNVVMLM
jgi:hypothetical protein